ncbi:MFS transporter [Paenibacillus sediminis]|uniref:OHS family lactose permease-like MFS transporter n=1 Tax=Paenibacillus sediminis TaxID=664909 RepID=A0ABS4H162_9BACL|nr:MFS transporter [Paenibacillus sediminis]MBP1936221.1 OHS family lactose permease-like MFS transporter [Paenibacillus sediminis]
MFKNKASYWTFSGFFYFYFVSFSFAMSLFGIWLKQAAGLDGAQTGIVFAINSVAALCIHPLYGVLSDKLGLRKHLLWLIIVLLLSAGPFVEFVYSPLLQKNIWLGALVGSLYLAATFTSGNAAIETFVEKIGRKDGFEYGQARMFGSLGWATATFFAGQTFNISANLNFWICSIGAIILGILFYFSRVDSNQEQTPQAKSDGIKLSDITELLRNRKFWAFVMYIVGVTCIFTIYDQQFPVYFSSLFESPEIGNRMYGYLNCVQVLAEAGCMFIAPMIVSKIGSKRGLILGGALMCIRITCSGLAEDPWLVAATKLIHSFELPVMFISIFKYIGYHFNKRVSSTMYLVGYQFSGTLASVVLAPVVGQLYDSIGFSRTYLMMGAYVFVFTVISACTLSGTRTERDLNETRGVLHVEH